MSSSLLNTIRIVLQGGDNMLGRAVGLTLPYQTIGDDTITDTQSAQDYLDDILPGIDVKQIRALNVGGEYLWGDLPFDLDEDARIINLEAAPTLSINNDDVPAKGIHYHVDLNNLPGLFSKFVRPYVLCLANNHSMDMGRKALIGETLPNVSNIIGVGMNDTEAYAPRIIGNVAIFAFGAGCAGVPSDWRATNHTAGVAYLPPIINEYHTNEAFNIIRTSTRTFTNKCIVISIHWGPNEATHNDGQQYRELLAHRLIDELGVALIHGHSSHHIRGLELYNGHLILYGAGDFVNDYEKIDSSYNKSGALYVVDLNSIDYHLINLTFIPFEIVQLQCKAITDPNKIKSLRAFVNKQSIRDSTHPLLI